jgi:Ca-activated chloride channel family protein
MSDLLALAGQLHFLRPWWLLGLVLVPALALWWRSRTRRRSVWQDAVDAHLLPRLLDGQDVSRDGRWTRRSALLAGSLAVLALAGPSVRKVEHPLWQAQAPLVVALDLSPAALARDLPPSRLAQARAKIATLLRERAGGQVGLVVFADDAYTVAPLTADVANVALFLDALAPDIMPGDGRPAEAPRADRAIAWAQRLLRNGGFDHGDILLLTDRADGDALAEAAKARLAGYRVSALGLGTAQGGVFDTPGGLGRARLDAGSLQQLAASGGGTYRQLAAGSDDLRALGVLDPRSAGAAGARGGKVASWRDEGYWLLPLALLFGLPLFRRGGALAAVLACVMLLPSTPAHAQEAGGLWRRADQQAHARLQEGVAAYRRQQYDKAIADFSGIPTAEGQYNLGNALAKAGRYDEAIAAYDRALKQRPAMADALANRKAVDAARKRKPPPGQQPQQGPQPSGKAGEQGQPSPQQQDGKPQPNPSPSRAPPSPPPRDPMQQQRADAAQRQRMQEALAKQRDAQAPRPAPQRTQETAEQRERRIANDAQLQRVPDDPGALLRAKFRLEYERRQGGR